MNCTASLKSGLIPGGRSLKRDKQFVFFTEVNPMDDSQDLEEVQYDLDKPRIAVYKKYLELTKRQYIGAI